MAHGVTHRGSGRGPTTVADASHLDAADAARAVAIRRDRLIDRQREPYAYSEKRQAEIDMLGEVWRLYRAFDDARHKPPVLTTDEELLNFRREQALWANRHRPKGRDIGT
jgi:hypothetical protein